MAEFFAMGGYAVYVWPSYGLFVGWLAVSYGTAVARDRRIRRRILSQAQEQDA